VYDLIINKYENNLNVKYIESRERYDVETQNLPQLMDDLEAQDMTWTGHMFHRMHLFL